MKAVMLVATDAGALYKQIFLLIGKEGRGLLLMKNSLSSDRWGPVCHCCISQRFADAVSSEAAAHGVTRVLYEGCLVWDKESFPETSFLTWELEWMSQGAAAV